MANPFLPYDGATPPDRDFVGMYAGTLSAAEQVQAKLLLQVASNRIRALHLPKTDDDLDIDDAQQVVYEIVRDAVRYGDLEKLSSFENRTSLRHEIGAFDEAAKVVDDYLTNKHKRLLGIAVLAAPRGHFVRCDY